MVVLQGKAFDGPGQAGLDDVIEAGAPAAKAHTTEEGRVAVHGMVEDGRRRLVVIAYPGFIRAFLPLVEVAIGQGGDETGIGRIIAIGVVAAPGV